MTITATSVFAEKDPLTSCDNRTFNKAYYLLNKKDFADAGDFLLLNDLQFNFKRTNFKSFMGQRDRVTTFYDFDNLALNKANKELFHIQDNNLPVYRAEKEKVFYIDNLSIPEVMQRFEVKKYNKKTSSLDKHPLFSRIKRKERSILIDHLSNVSKDPPGSILESLQIESTEKVHLITLFGISHAEVTLSNFTISNTGVPNTSLLLKIEMFNDQRDNLNEYEKEYLDTLICLIDEKFQTRFPHIKRKPRFGYVEYNNLATNIQPNRELFRKYPGMYSIGQIICLSIIGFLFIYLILGRYARNASYRKVSKMNHDQ